MSDNRCPYFDLDVEAQKEAEEIVAAYREMVGEKQWEAEMRMAEEMAAGAPDDPRDPCYGCRHFKSGPGFPGETVYSCRHPDHEHIIYIDFDPSAVI